ncbi:hypothetical protein BDV18DRAFT_33421 [Aspergillus unguis]
MSEQEQVTRTKEFCFICADWKQSEQMVTLRCSHHECKDCIRKQAFSRFPPSCCDWKVSDEALLECLSREELAMLKSRSEERALPASKRWYCPGTSCRKWIPPEELLVKGSRLTCSRTYTCPYCQVNICYQCRQQVHEGKCPPDANAGILALAAQQNWARCKRCGILVERIDGCPAVRCQCGNNFCHFCGGKAYHCNCLTRETARVEGGELRERLLRWLLRRLLRWP